MTPVVLPYMRRKNASTDKAKADGIPLPAPNTCQVIPAHFNAKIDPKRMDAIAECALTGKRPEDLDQVVTDRGLVKLKTIELPPGCPADHEEWRTEVARLLGIAVYKMASRLAAQSDAIPLNALPVAMAISLDKRLLLTGAPTSYAVSAHLTVNHADLLKRINSPAKPHTIDETNA